MSRFFGRPIIEILGTLVTTTRLPLLNVLIYIPEANIGADVSSFAVRQCMRRIWPQEASHCGLLLVHRWMPDIVRSIPITHNGKRLILARD